MYNTNLSFHYCWPQCLTEARNLPSVAPSSGHEAVLPQNLSAPQPRPPSLCSWGSAVSSSEKSLPLELHVIFASSPGLSSAASATQDEQTNAADSCHLSEWKLMYVIWTKTQAQNSKDNENNVVLHLLHSVLWVVPHGISELKPRTKAGVQVSCKRQMKKEWHKETVIDTGPRP